MTPASTSISTTRRLEAGAGPDGSNTPVELVELVTVAVSDYPKSGGSISALPEVVEARKKVAALFGANLVRCEDWSAEARSKTTIQGRFDAWSKAHTGGSIVYWTGHGEIDGGGYVALLGDAVQTGDAATRMEDRDFATPLRNRHQRRPEDYTDAWVLLILDTCASRLGAWNTYRHLTGAGVTPPVNIAVLGTGEDDGCGYVGGFPDVLEKKLAGFTRNDQVVQVGELVRRISESYSNRGDANVCMHGTFTTTACLPRRPAQGSIQAPQDLAAELDAVLAKVDPVIAGHFYAKAQGAELGQLAWHFTGRIKERRALVDWLTHAGGGMYVVTGLAGSGKSALLGMILACSNPEMLTALKHLGYPPIDAQYQPPPEVFTAVVHLSGRTIAEVAGSIAAQLGLGTGLDVEELVHAVAALPDGWRTLLTDALDEARDPYPIASLLARLAASSGTRVLVGTRQSLHEDPDHPIPTDRVLLDALGAPPQPGPGLMRLDRSASAIVDYVRGRLTSSWPHHLDTTTQTQETPEETITRLADRISEVDQPFLFARLAVHEILADPAWTDPEADLTALLEHGHTGLFDRARARLAQLNPDIEHLLHALAYARGNGFPRTGGIWAAAAGALAGHSILDNTIDTALSAAAPYIMLDTEFGDSVYRLAHRTFTERYVALDEP